MYTIIGIEHVDYVSKKDNQRKQGTRLHMTYEDKKTEGLCVLEQYCSSKVDCEGLALGDVVRLLYNRWGSVEAVELME